MDFEERRRGYLKELKDDSLTEMLIKEAFKENGNTENIDIVISPKDERQLTYAKAVYTGMSDASSLELKVATGGVRPTPLEENEAITLMINEIKALLNGSEYDSTEEFKSMITRARIYYGRMTLRLSDCSDYVIEKSGAKEGNRKHLKLIKEYLKNKNVEKEKELPFLFGKYSEMTDEEIEGLSEFSNELHRLCEKYSYSLVEAFADMLFGKVK